MADNYTAHTFRVGFVNDNFPLLFTSHGGFQRGILNDIYSFFAQLNGLKLQWVLAEDYGSQQSDGSYSGLLGDIYSGRVAASVERSYREDRLKHFSFTQPVIYQADTYLTRNDLISTLSLSNILVFSPLMILFIALTFAVSFFVEKVTHAIHLRFKLGPKDSFYYLFGKTGHSIECNSKTSGSVFYRFVFTRVLAGAFIHMIYTSVFTGSTVFSVAKDLDLIDMIDDIRQSHSKLIIEHPSFLNSQKTNAIFGPGYSFPSESVIRNKEDFIEHLCKNAADYGKVNSFFLTTVNPQQKTKYPCEIATIAPGKWQNQTSSIQNSVIQPSPYTLLLRKNEKSRLKKSLNAVIITIFQFEKISTIHWRRYTNRNLNLPKSDSSITSNIVKLPEIAFLFYALLVGFTISAIALFIEILIRLNVSKNILMEISKLY